MHRHGYAQRSDDQCDETDQAQKIHCPVEPPANRGMRLAVVGDQSMVEYLLELPAGLLDAQALGWQTEQVTLRGPAAGLDQPAAFEPLAADDDPRPDVQRAGHAIGFDQHHGREPKHRVAQTQPVADLRVQPYEQIR